jgi:hypothetical protein
LTNIHALSPLQINLGVNDAKELCEYFAARLKPIRVEYNGKTGALRIGWSPIRRVTTYKSLKRCLEKVRPITEDSNDINAVAYAFHPKVHPNDTNTERRNGPSEYPSHVILESPNGEILVITGASGVHTSPDIMSVSQGDVEVVPSDGIHRTTGTKWIVGATQAYVHSRDQPINENTALGRIRGKDEAMRRTTTNIRIIPRIRKK